MRKREGRQLIGLYTIGITAIFMAGFFFLVIIGARSYNLAVDAQMSNSHKRELLAYISTSMKANDTEGSVEIQDSNYGKVLVLADGTSGYGLRIYRYNNNLVEDFGRLGYALVPEEAQVIGKADVFDIEEVSSDTYTVTTDEGSVTLHMRSGGGAVN